VPIDPLTEQTIPLAEAARRLPRLRAGRPVSPTTLWRWAAHGLRGVRLEVVRVGGTTCTSVEALRRFFARLDGTPVPTTAAQAGASPARVEAQLDAIGI
jgi:hypothetical protein